MLEGNDSGTDEFDSSSDEESSAIADEIDDRDRTSRFGKAIKLSNKLLS